MGVRDAPQCSFLKARHGPLFLAFYPPSSTSVPHGGVLFVHPLAEEMNKSRRMASLQARKLAALGYAVLTVDLHGCGDSSGDFREARWERWIEDLVLAHSWLQSKIGQGQGIGLWGLRLGALLALDLIRHLPTSPAFVLLWQPVLKGEGALTEFLRIAVAAEMMNAGKGITVKQLRAEFAAGRTVEVAGYEVASELAQALDQVKMADIKLPECSYYWIEVARDGGKPLTFSARKQVGVWSESGMKVDSRVVKGEPFWKTVEISDCPALIEATSEIFASGH